MGVGGGVVFGLEIPQREMLLKHCKYRGFWRNVQKTSYVSRCLRFSIGIYGVF